MRLFPLSYYKSLLGLATRGRLYFSPLQEILEESERVYKQSKNCNDKHCFFVSCHICAKSPFHLRLGDSRPLPRCSDRTIYYGFCINTRSIVSNSIKFTFLMTGRTLFKQNYAERPSKESYILKRTDTNILPTV